MSHNSAIVIRTGTTEDLVALTDMARRFHMESGYRMLMPLNLAAVVATITSLLTRDGCTVLVADLDGMLVGMLGLATYTHPMSAEFVAGEIAWWVEPEFRGMTGVRLLRRAECWALENGAKRLYMIAPTVEVCALYGRLNYVKVETTYQKSLTRQEAASDPDQTARVEVPYI